MAEAKVGIIGAGPAGISAGVQLKRYGIKSVIFERDRIGGLVRNAYLVENTILYPEGISGVRFAEILEEYARKYNLHIVLDEVIGVKEEGNSLILKTGEEEHEFRYVIAATGTVPKKLPYPGLKYHVTEMNRKHYGHVVIIGGGDIALDYALSMSERCRKVTVLHRSELKALPALQRYVKKRKNIELVRGEVKHIEPGDGKKIVLTDSHELKADEILVAIGREPNLQILRGIHASNLLIIGDAKNGIYRQTSLAIGDGIKAAMQIWRWEKYGDTQHGGR